MTPLTEITVSLQPGAILQVCRTDPSIRMQDRPRYAEDTEEDGQMGDALTEPGSLPRFAPANDLSLGSLCPLWQSPQKRDLFATEITEGAEGACLVESAVIPCVSAPRSESGSGATPNPPVPHSPLRPSRLRERTSTDPVRLAPTPPLTPSAPENRFAARPTGEAMALADSPKRVPVEPHRPERKLASMQDRPRYRRLNPVQPIPAMPRVPVGRYR